MRRDKLKKLVGKKVEIVFFDDDIKIGTLGKGLGLGNGYYNDDESWFYLKEHRLNFRASHIKKVKELENA